MSSTWPNWPSWSSLRSWPNLRGGSVLLLAFAVHAALAFANRDLRAAWPGVAEPPPVALATALALGDAQLAYRRSAFDLQNLGDRDGERQALRAYDYQRLVGWLGLLDQLDPAADFAPTLAGFYFSQTPDRDDLRRIVDHLLRIGARDPVANWRWLTHAVYLARHKLNDTRLALEVAHHLAAIDDPGVPIWVRQLPAFVLAKVGEHEAARDLLQAILASAPDLDPDEARFMQRYIQTRLPAAPS